MKGADYRRARRQTYRLAISAGRKRWRRQSKDRNNTDAENSVESRRVELSVEISQIGRRNVAVHGAALSLGDSRLNLLHKYGSRKAESRTLIREGGARCE